MFVLQLKTDVYFDAFDKKQLGSSSAYVLAKNEIFYTVNIKSLVSNHLKISNLRSNISNLKSQILSSLSLKSKISSLEYQIISDQGCQKCSKLYTLAQNRNFIVFSEISSGRHECAWTELFLLATSSCDTFL